MNQSLIKQLEKEAGLTPEQAEQAVAVVLAYLREHDLDPTWKEFLTGKAKKTMEKAEKVGDQMSEQINGFADNANKAIDDLTDKTQKKIKELKNKAGHYLLDDEDEK